MREVFGYERFDEEHQAIEMNAIFKECFNLLQNFFVPQIKTKELKRIGAKYVRKCDIPKTPYQRLLESKDLPLNKKIDLQKKFETLNPIELKKKLDLMILRFNQKLPEFNNLDEVA